MTVRAVRPFYSSVQDPARDRSLRDYVWPIGSSHTVHDETQWRFLVFFGFNHTTNDPGQRYRTWLFPFYFQGRDASGQTYRALFPVAGTLRDFVGRDEISFVLFPLYSRSQLNEISTHNVLWPFISRTTSTKDHIYRARVFPFYGVNRHRDKFDKRFILWPVYTEAHYYYEKGHGHAHILFPLYGIVNLDTEKTLWVLPPFFRFTRGEAQNITFAPWPFFQRRVGNGIDQLYIWPLWGRKKVDQLERSFYLWPFIWTEYNDRPAWDSSRLIVAPFFSHTAVRADAVATNGVAAEPAVLERRHKLWPLYSYRRDGEASRLRFLELWPFADAPAVERNWAPFWSLYARHSISNNVDTEILWGLYRNHRRADAFRYVSLFPLVDYTRDEQTGTDRKSWNLLKGLIGYERKDSQKSLRLLYVLRIPLGKDESP